MWRILANPVTYFVSVLVKWLVVCGSHEDATETCILWNVSILVTSVTAIDIPMVDCYMVDDFVCGFDTICIVSDGINTALTLGTVKVIL